jgi:hypothetical protein
MQEPNWLVNTATAVGMTKPGVGHAMLPSVPWFYGPSDMEVTPGTTRRSATVYDEDHGRLGWSPDNSISFLGD